MLTVIGEALIDLVGRADDGHTFDAHPGGSPLNVAVGLARLGHPTALLARLSADAFGRRLRGYAEQNQVDLSWAVSADEPSTLAVVSLDRQGQAEYDFYVQATADWQWTGAEIAGLPPASTTVHTGSLAAWLAPGGPILLDRLRGLRAEQPDVLVSFDPNLRPGVIGDRAAIRAAFQSWLQTAQLVKASDEDLAWLYPNEAIDDLVPGWLNDAGPTLVVVTRGGSGATAWTSELGRVDRPAPSVEVVDTVGAGDAFMAGLLSAVTDAGLGAADLARLDRSQLGRLVDRAALVAAFTCGRAGADPPTRAELDRSTAAADQ
jgi:fructokinase